MREKMSCRRQDLVEEMIKRDPMYRPPPDYRCALPQMHAGCPNAHFSSTAVESAVSVDVIPVTGHRDKNGSSLQECRSEPSLDLT